MMIIGSSLEKILIISGGAVLGANARYWLVTWVSQKWTPTFPLGTFLVNLTGSLLIGFFMTLTTERLMIDPRWRLFFAVGFLGAYTTFSTFSYESLSLILKGQWLSGSLNIIGSAVLGISAALLGVYLGRTI